MRSLAGQIVLITGAPAGVGPLLSCRLARDGAWIGVNFRRDLEGAKQLVDAIRCDGGRAMLVPGDPADPAEAWSILERIDLQWGSVDVVVEQGGSEGRPGAHLWPPVDRPNASIELARAALQRTPDVKLVVLTTSEENAPRHLPVRVIRARPPDTPMDIADTIFTTLVSSSVLSLGG